MAKKTLWLWGIYAASSAFFLTLGIRNLSDGEQIGWWFIGAAALQVISIVVMAIEERKKIRQPQIHRGRPSGRAGTADE